MYLHILKFSYAFGQRQWERNQSTTYYVCDYNNSHDIINKCIKTLKYLVGS